MLTIAELIELWETYLLQLDSDEDGPPLMPVGVAAAAGVGSETGKSNEAERTNDGTGEQHENEETRLSGTTARDSEDALQQSQGTAFEQAAAALENSEVDAQ